MADTEGFDEMINFLADLPKEINNALDSGLNKTTIGAVTDVKERTPVGVYPKGSGRTGGTLKRGWSSSEIVTTAGDKTQIIGNAVPYADWVENGHKTMQGRGRSGRKAKAGGKVFVEGKHMLRDTMTLYEDRNILENNLSAELQKILG